MFWAVRRLHKYLFGIKFTIVTDHQALQFLFNPDKSVAKSTAAMIQRWSIALSAYYYDIQHRPGKEIPQADFLSRYSKFAEPTQCNFITTAIPVSREQLRAQTKRHYGPLIAALSKGWTPAMKKKFGKYFVHREEIMIQPDGVLCRADRLIIPPSLRKAILDDLHKGHMGMEKMKSLARQTCWWPEVDEDIRSTVKNCAACLQKLKYRPKDWTPWPESYVPWQRVHADFCGPFLNHYYALVVIDSYSKWPEVFLTNTPTATFTMQALRKLFSREGIPQVLVTDNGSQFVATDMKTWLDSIGCRHLRTAPRHPCSNGAAENLVRTVKSAISSADPKTLQELDTFVDNFLLQYRNATHSTTKETPARLFKGRSLRASVMCIDSTDVQYFRGNDLRPSRGIITRRLGNSMVEITDLDDTTVHRRHTDQIQLKEPPRPTAEETQPAGAVETTTIADQDAGTTSLPDETPPSPTVTRKSVRRASQIDEAFLREESCGDRTSSQFQTTSRYSFHCVNQVIDSTGQSRIACSTARLLDGVINSTGQRPMNTLESSVHDVQ